MKFLSRIINLLFLVLLSSCNSAQENGLIKKALSEDLDWERASTENFVLYAPSGTFAAENFDLMGSKAEAARRLVMERLQVVKQEEPPILIFLDSPEQMEKFSGVPTGGRAVVKENGVFLVTNNSESPPLRHELGHLYSWRSWGDPTADWLSEGVAVYAAGDCAGEDLHAWAAKMALDNSLVDFSDLEQEFDSSKAAPHLQAGSFVKYIMEKYGVLSFRMIWEGGLDASSEATGLEMDALLENWTTHIMQNEYTAAAQFLDLMEKMKCG